MKKIGIILTVMIVMLITAGLSFANDGANTGLSGITLAIAGAFIAVFFAGVGSCLGVALAGQAANGLLSEDPERFGSLLILVAMPGTQGIYGFIGAFLIVQKLNFLAAPVVSIPVEQGWSILFAAIPVGLGGLVSAIYQGKVCASGVAMTAKQPDAAMKGVIYGALVETYAILGLLATILLLNGIIINV